MIELLCAMGIILVLAALLFPALRKARLKARQIECVDHLHETGLGFQSFAHDHDGRFPMAVPASAGGSLEFVRGAQHIQGDFYFSFRHFQVLSNELTAPKLLVCPADTRLPASNFGELRNENVSYFIGVTAEPSQPDSILAGDRNVTNDFARAGTVQRLGQNACLRWTEEMHGFKGNLLFSDGRVEAKSGLLLMSANDRGPTAAELVLPTVQSTPGLPGSPDNPLITATPVGQGSPGLSASSRQNQSVVGFEPGEIAHRQEGDPPWMPFRQDSPSSPPRPTTEPPQILPPSVPAIGQSESVPLAELTTVPGPKTPNASAVPPPLTDGFNVVATTAPPARTSPWVYFLILLLLVLLLVLAIRARSAIRAANEKSRD